MKNYFGDSTIVEKLRPKCFKTIDYFGYSSIALEIIFSISADETDFLFKIWIKYFVFYLLGVIFTPVIFEPANLYNVSTTYSWRISVSPTNLIKCANILSFPWRYSNKVFDMAIFPWMYAFFYCFDLQSARSEAAKKNSAKAGLLRDLRF